MTDFSVVDAKLKAAAQAYLVGDKARWDEIETRSQNVAEEAAVAILEALKANEQTACMIPSIGVPGMAVALGRAMAASMHTAEEDDPAQLFALVFRMLQHGYALWMTAHDMEDGNA